MRGQLLITLSALVVFVGFLNIASISALGFWLLFGFFCLLFISFGFIKESFQTMMLLFFIISAVIGGIAILRNGLDLIPLVVIVLALTGEILMMVTEKPKRVKRPGKPLKKPSQGYDEPLIKKSDVLDKEIPKEEEPKIVITDVEQPKFLASKRGQFFHTVDCPMAARISFRDLLKFTNKEEALSFGYVGHNCIKD